MAKASWCITSPSSGTGNGTVAISGSNHTGRSARTTTVTVSATGVTEKTVNVSQAAAGNITTGVTPATIAKGGETIKVTGTSNSTKLTFALSGTGFTLGALEISTDGGTTWTAITSATAIAGDPGGAATYQWRANITVVSNPTITSRTATLTATPGEGTAVTVTCTQAAGDPTLTVSPATINLVAVGTAQNVTITSNTSWTVS